MWDPIHLAGTSSESRCCLRPSLPPLPPLRAQAPQLHLAGAPQLLLPPPLSYQEAHPVNLGIYLLQHIKVRLCTQVGPTRHHLCTITPALMTRTWACLGPTIPHPALHRLPWDGPAGWPSGRVTVVRLCLRLGILPAGQTCSTQGHSWLLLDSRALALGRQTGSQARPGN